MENSIGQITSELLVEALGRKELTIINLKAQLLAAQEAVVVEEDSLDEVATE